MARPGKIVCVSLLACFMSMNAYAHRNWLLPSSTNIEGKEPWVTVDAATSENLFEIDGSAQNLDALVVLDPEDLPTAPQNVFNGKLRSGFDVKLDKPGTYKMALVRETVLVDYKLKGESKRWRGDEKDMDKNVPAEAIDVSVTHMHARQETFVTTGKPTTAVLKPNGIGLELVPVTHPTDLRVGEAARFRFLLDGKPLGNHLISVVPGGVRYRGVLKEIAVTTDAQGEFTVTWPDAGMYWIGASFPPRAPAPAAPPARRLSYSGTFEVMPQ